MNRASVQRAPRTDSFSRPAFRDAQVGAPVRPLFRRRPPQRFHALRMRPQRLPSAVMLALVFAPSLCGQQAPITTVLVDSAPDARATTIAVTGALIVANAAGA